MLSLVLRLPVVSLCSYFALLGQLALGLFISVVHFCHETHFLPAPSPTPTVSMPLHSSHVAAQNVLVSASPLKFFPGGVQVDTAHASKAPSRAP